MNEDQLTILHMLEDIYDEAQQACNPIEFQNRQLKLLWALSEAVLQPLRDHEKQIHLEILKKTKKVEDLKQDS